MVAMKNFTTLQMVEKVLWLILSFLAIVVLCFQTESSFEAINGCSKILCNYDAHQNQGSTNLICDETINQEIKVIKSEFKQY